MADTPLTPFEIGKPGRAVATNGVAFDFTPAVLADLAEGYDPARHHAPLVVGHPQTNSPAFGWVRGLQWMAHSQRLLAVPEDVNPDFAEAVNRKAYKHVSMSIYLPDSPGNPDPGRHSLRHVGFLGGKPPAIKGLKEVSFAEAEPGVLTFGEYDDALVAGLFRRLREWLLTEKGQAVADQVIPAEAVDFLTQSAAQEAQEDAAELQNTPQFSEPPPEAETMTDKTEELAARETALAAREQALKAQEAQIRRDEALAFAEGLVAAGKLAPADKDGLAGFIAGLEDQTLEFGEGEAKARLPRKAWLKAFLSKLPKVVDFGEFDSGAANDGNGSADIRQVAAKARQYRDDQHGKGNYISFAEAVDHVTTTPN